MAAGDIPTLPPAPKLDVGTPATAIPSTARAASPGNSEGYSIADLANETRGPIKNQRDTEQQLRREWDARNTRAKARQAATDKDMSRPVTLNRKVSR